MPFSKKKRVTYLFHIISLRIKLFQLIPNVFYLLIQKSFVLLNLSNFLFSSSHVYQKVSNLKNLLTKQSNNNLDRIDYDS